MIKKHKLFGTHQFYDAAVVREAASRGALDPPLEQV
jgi:hypothetical protein